jgi:hypothetical protein
VSAGTSGCTKQAYPTLAAAQAALAKHGDKYQTTGKKRLRPYPCDRCTAWHLTHKYSGKKVPPWEKNPNWTRPDIATG